MAALKEMKKKLKEASEMERINICKGESDRVLIDLNGDDEPEAALIDTTGNGEADLLALDLTGDHKFNLYLDDTDDNKFPDVLYMDAKGDGNYQLIGVGEESRGKLHEKLVKIYSVLTDEGADADALSDALHELAKIVKEIKDRRAK